MGLRENIIQYFHVTDAKQYFSCPLSPFVIQSAKQKTGLFFCFEEVAAFPLSEVITMKANGFSQGWKNKNENINYQDKENSSSMLSHSSSIIKKPTWICTSCKTHVIRIQSTTTYIHSLQYCWHKKLKSEQNERRYWNIIWSTREATSIITHLHRTHLMSCTIKLLLQLHQFQTTWF